MINTKTQAWVATIRPHWARCLGNIHNDSKFWNECIHKVSDDTWQAIVDSYKSTIALHNWISSAYPKLDEDMYELEWRLRDHTDPETGDIHRVHITKPYDKTGYNRPIFRAVMAFKDVVGELVGDPFKDYSKPKSIRRNKPTQAEVMAKYEELGRVLQELYTTGE